MSTKSVLKEKYNLFSSVRRDTNCIVKRLMVSASRELDAINNCGPSKLITFTVLVVLYFNNALKNSHELTIHLKNFGKSGGH